MKYIYTATFTSSDDGTKFFARVPDFPGCIATGNSLCAVICSVSVI